MAKVVKCDRCNKEFYFFYWVSFPEPHDYALCQDCNREIRAEQGDKLATNIQELYG